MTAVARLVQRVRSSGARRIAFVGLAKNAGKTTALVETLGELHRLGIVAGATSAGRDGEAFDLLTGEPKPRFRLWPGQLVASAESTFDGASLRCAPVRVLPFRTRFGPIAIRRAEGPGQLEVIGPATASEIAATSAALEAEGAVLVLLDGAFGRRAFASLRVAGGVVLSVGMSAGSSLESVLEAARGAVELLRLSHPPVAAPARVFTGALTEEALAERPLRSGEILVAEDFAAIFLSPETRRRLAGEGVKLAVVRPAGLIAVTANPTSPGRPGLDAGDFFRALEAALPGIPLVDLRAGLSTF